MKLVLQFGFRDGPPPEGVPVVDCRTIENPWTKSNDPKERRRLVRLDPEYETKVRHALSILREHDVVAIGCTHGKDRSGAVAEEVASQAGAQIIGRAEWDYYARKLDGSDRASAAS